MATEDFLVKVQWTQQQTPKNVVNSSKEYATTLANVLKYAENRALEGQDTEILDSLYFVKEMTGKVHEDNLREYATALEAVLRYAERHAMEAMARKRQRTVAH